MEVFCLWNKIYVYLRNTPQNMRSFLETLFERFKSLLQFLGYPVSFITNPNKTSITFCVLRVQIRYLQNKYNSMILANGNIAVLEEKNVFRVLEPACYKF